VSETLLFPRSLKDQLKGVTTGSGPGSLAARD
jgi:hypothetical protein